MSTPRPASRSSTRNAIYRWVRQIHLWVGAWGALASLLFGLTGLFMANRFGDNAWPQGDSRESAPLTLDVPVDARGSKEALRDWLRATYKLDATTIRASRPPGGRIEGRDVKQPPKWSLSGGTARRSWSVEYVPGNATAELKRSVQSPLAAMLRLHKGVGGGLAWRLLQNSFAIGMILLGLSGIWMWARGRSPREMLVSVMGVGTIVFLIVVRAAMG